ncbi:MAG: recombinase family protein [Streptococcaceae bacterium]|nr:recombinase family protein [Streptococcaceae bacterium]
MKYGYALLNNSEQDAALQTEELIQAGVEPENIFLSKSQEISTSERQIEKLLFLIEENDELVVTKLHYLSRSTVQIKDVVTKILEKRATLTILNIGTLDQSETGKLLTNAFFILIDFAYESMQAGRKRKRENKEGYQDGRNPKKTIAEIKEIFQEIQQHQEQGIAEKHGINRSTIYRYKKKYPELWNDVLERRNGVHKQ